MSKADEQRSAAHCKARCDGRAAAQVIVNAFEWSKLLPPGREAPPALAGFQLPQAAISELQPSPHAQEQRQPRALARDILQECRSIVHSMLGSQVRSAALRVQCMCAPLTITFCCKVQLSATLHLQACVQAALTACLQCSMQSGNLTWSSCCRCRISSLSWRPVWTPWGLLSCAMPSVTASRCSCPPPSHSTTPPLLRSRHSCSSRSQLIRQLMWSLVKWCRRSRHLALIRTT